MLCSIWSFLPPVSCAWRCKCSVLSGLFYLLSRVPGDVNAVFYLVVVVVDPTPPTCCQQSPATESCGSQQSLPPGGKERLHFVGIRPEVQARMGGW